MFYRSRLSDTLRLAKALTPFGDRELFKMVNGAEYPDAYCRMREIRDSVYQTAYCLFINFVSQAQ